MKNSKSILILFFFVIGLMTACNSNLTSAEVSKSLPKDLIGLKAILKSFADVGIEFKETKRFYSAFGETYQGVNPNVYKVSKNDYYSCYVFDSVSKSSKAYKEFETNPTQDTTIPYNVYRIKNLLIFHLYAKADMPNGKPEPHNKDQIKKAIEQLKNI